MRQREDTAVGIHMALAALLMMLCLVGAFCLPGSITSSRVLGCFGLLGLCVIPALQWIATRSRMRSAVAERGVLVSLRRVPRWRSGYYRYRSLARTRFEVEYIDLMGNAHRALCNSSWFSGVEWLEDDVVDISKADGG